MGFDVWEYHDATATTRSQFLGNMWDETQLSDVTGVGTEADLWDWLRNVWAPAIFPLRGDSAFCIHACIGAL